MAVRASEAQAHAGMAAQQSDMQQLQAELRTVTAVRWDLPDIIYAISKTLYTLVPECCFILGHDASYIS